MTTPRLLLLLLAIPITAGAAESEFEGKLRVMGRELSLVSENSALTPPEVIERAHRSARDLPVDLHVGRVPRGLYLSVLDVHAGVQRILLALEWGGGGSRIFEGTSSLHGSSVLPLPPLPLPSSCSLLGHVEDRVTGAAVHTLVAFCTDGEASVRTALFQTLLLAGFVHRGGGEWSRGAERATVDLAGEGPGCRLLLRIEEAK